MFCVFTHARALFGPSPVIGVVGRKWIPIAPLFFVALGGTLIYGAVSGFGHTGPEADKPAYDMVVQARGGVMSITGEEGGPPVRVGASIGIATRKDGDVNAEQLLVNADIALYEAKRHGLLVDYRGSLKALDTAVHAYRDLEAGTQGGFDPADLEGMYRPWRPRPPRPRGLPGRAEPGSADLRVREPDIPYRMPVPPPRSPGRGATPCARGPWTAATAGCSSTPWPTRTAGCAAWSPRPASASARRRWC